MSTECARHGCAEHMRVKDVCRQQWLQSVTVESNPATESGDRIRGLNPATQSVEVRFDAPPIRERGLAE